MTTRDNATLGNLVLRFLHDLPKALRDKHDNMIKNVTEFCRNDADAREQYKSIVNNSKFQFHDKIEALNKLSVEYEMREADKRHRKELKEGLDNLNMKIMGMETQAAVLESSISCYQEESRWPSIKQKKGKSRCLAELERWVVQLKSVHMDPKDHELFVRRLWDIRADFEDELRWEEKGW